MKESKNSPAGISTKRFSLGRCRLDTAADNLDYSFHCQQRIELTNERCLEKEINRNTDVGLI